MNDNNEDSTMGTESFKICEKLAALPSLRSISLLHEVWEAEEGDGDSFMRISERLGRSMNELLLSNTVSSLWFGAVHITNPVMMTIVQALQNKKGLKSLTLHAMRADCIPGETCPQSLDVLTDYLRTDTTLEDLCLGFTHRQPFINDFLVKVAQAIQRNAGTSLKMLTICGARLPFESTVMGAFLDMIKTNYTIHSLDLLYQYSYDDEFQNGGEQLPSFDRDFRMSGDSMDAIDFYVQLNRRGRRRLLTQHEQISKEQWVNVFVEFANDIQVLHYYLHLNPWLCVYNSDSRKKKSSKIKASPKIPQDDPRALQEEIERLNRQLQQYQKKTQDLLEENKRLREGIDSTEEMKHKRPKSNPPR